MADIDARGWGAQSHLANNLPYAWTASDPAVAERDRVQSHSFGVHGQSFGSRANAKGYPDVYVNGEDVTVTIDPIKNSVWIRDDAHAERHDASNHRGGLKDHKGVMRTLRFISDSENIVPPHRNYDQRDMKMELDKALKFSTECVKNSTRGARGAPGAIAREGTLPQISALNYNSVAGDGPTLDDMGWKPNGRDWEPKGLYHEGTAPFVRDVNRAFDCEGNCR